MSERVGGCKGTKPGGARFGNKVGGSPRAAIIKGTKPGS